ncbi:MAG: sigma-54-dependent Fis family transcriptional regulator [Saprospiraceae bacterium]|nr:sigma-54-dependent Fis family transcriptional regulator [Saprospiraceae bacterium]
MNIQSVKQRFGIIGKSPLLERALSTAIRVANTDLSVFIQGESGVGKEVFSKIIHELSARKHNSFIAVNCGAIPSGTINSELFGHEKGAFTGAVTDRKGYFETVNGGTIFLDEIGEMPLDTQAFLLRILESGEFIRVGSSKVMTTDVRVIAATNVNLDEKIASGKFREDLYYRLNTVPIKVPALFERQEDIYMLIRKFASDFADKYKSKPILLSTEARMIIEHYRWPGNIRELKNLVEQLAVLSEHEEVSVEELLMIAPHLSTRNLPSSSLHKGFEANFQERELLFKFLLDMKADLNDLKSLVFELIQNNDLAMPDVDSYKGKMSTSAGLENFSFLQQKPDHRQSDVTTFAMDDRPSIVIHTPGDEKYHEAETVDEMVSLESMEKFMIKKALKKYNNRRKEAADELGISERTLYRKIKEYDIPD